MVAKVNSVAAQFRKVSDLQMADTTKRTIQENVAINQQLSRMSDKVTASNPVDLILNSIHCILFPLANFTVI